MKIMAIGSALLLAGCATQRGFPPEHQISNFDHVDAGLYRGAQPTASGIEYLQSLGVKSIVCLREADDVPAYEKLAAERLGLIWTNLPMSGLCAPTKAQMDSILATIEALPAPIFVHCQFGCDRTGTVVACYRIEQGWSNQQALQEAETYGISKLLVGMRHFITHYQNGGGD